VNGSPSSVVSPGLWGFVAFFVLALALYLLMRNMNGRMRRMSYRAEERQREVEADAAERLRRKEGDASTDGSPSSGDGDGDEEQTGGPTS
jgi:membrane protein implicated in regulation of membrane protease activity